MFDDEELEFERDRSRDELADFFEEFAEGLRGDDSLTIEVGERMVTVSPPESVEFEIEVEDESEDDGVERSLEFELEWMRGEDERPLTDQEGLEE